MSFIIECPHCKKKMEAQDEWDGMQAPCPHCQQNVLMKRSEANLPQLAQKTQEVMKKKDDGIKTQKNKTADSKEKSSKKDDYSVAGCFSIVTVVIIIGLLCFLQYYPKTVFWISFPFVAITLLSFFDLENKLMNVLAILLCIVLIGWGWWAHTTVYGDTISVSYQCSDPDLTGDIYLIKYNDELFRTFNAWKDQNMALKGLEKIYAPQPDSLIKSCSLMKKQFWDMADGSAKIQQNVFDSDGVKFRGVPNGNYMIIARSEENSKKCTWLMKVIKKSSSESTVLEDSQCIEETVK